MPTNHHISDFTKAPDQILLDLINHDNQDGMYPSNLGLDQVTLGAPLESELPEVNTQLDVEAIEGSGYVGTVRVGYNRLNIQDFVEIMVGDELHVPVGDATEVAGLITKINAALGINLTEDDYVNAPIEDWSGDPTEVKTIVIEMKETSYVYIGELTVYVESEDILLQDVIENTILDGLYLKEAPDVDPSPDPTPDE